MIELASAGPQGPFPAGSLSKGGTAMPHRLAQLPKVVGAKQTLKAIQNGEAATVYLALDADEHVTGPLRAECERRGINIIEVESMAELGKACAIEVGSAVAAVRKSASE